MAPDFKERITRTLQPNRPLPDALPDGHMANPYAVPESEREPLAQTGIATHRELSSEAADRYLDREGSNAAVALEFEARAAIAKKRALEAEQQAERAAHRLTIERGGRARFA